MSTLVKIHCYVTISAFLDVSSENENQRVFKNFPGEFGDHKISQGFVGVVSIPACLHHLVEKKQTVNHQPLDFGLANTFKKRKNRAINLQISVACLFCRNIAKLQPSYVHGYRLQIYTYIYILIAK